MANIIKEIARKLADGSYENIAIGAKAENVITSHNITAEKILNTADVYNIEITVDKWSEGYNDFGTEIIIQDNEYTWEEILNKDIINLHFYAVDWGANATNYFRREEGYSNLSSVTFVYRTLNWSSNEVMTHYLYANLNEPYKFEFRIHRYAPATQLSQFDNDTNFVNKEYVDNLIPKNYIEIVLSENIGLDEPYEGVITEEQLAQLKQENSTAIKIINTSTDSVYYLLPSSVGEYENDFSGVYSQIGWDSASEMFINQIDINNTNFIYSKRLKLIPFKTSHLENNSNFITNTVNNLTNYYKKTETYTQTEINNLLNAITTLDIQVVTSKPESPNKTTIYLIGIGTDGTNDYEEWLYTDSGWELIGTTEIDLSNYATKDFTKETIDNHFFIVETIQQGSNYILDNITFDEIVEKFNNGGTMVCHVDGTDYIPLLSVTASKIMFSGIYQETSVSLDFTTDGVGVLTTTRLAENNTFNSYYTKQEVDTSLQNAVNSIDISKDWNENNPEATAYIQNRTHYVDGIEEIATITYSFEANTGEPAGENSEAFERWSPDFVEDPQFLQNIEEGKVYNIIWDGQLYECIPHMTGSRAYFGNLAIPMIGPDTGEPFCIVGRGTE